MFVLKNIMKKGKRTDVLGGYAFYANVLSELRA